MSDYSAMRERLKEGKEELKEFECVEKVEVDDTDIGVYDCKVWPASGFTLHDLFLELNGFKTEDYWYEVTMECDGYQHISILTK